MLGAICGDYIGSRFERQGHRIKTTEFSLFHESCHFTDDSVLTVAVADALLSGGPVVQALLEWAQRYPAAGYGTSFVAWANSGDHRPYGSWGNGSAMRASPAGWLSSSLEDAANRATRSAAPTHDHPSGIQGAVAVAHAVRMGLEGSSAQDIGRDVAAFTGYDLLRTPDSIRPGYAFDVSCQGSVPEALCCALSASSYEEAIRSAVSLGGDADTQAAIAGSVAETLFGIPDHIAAYVVGRMPHLMVRVLEAFRADVSRRTWPRMS
jgi:ADP-ribosylglycohydrolase